MENDNKRLFEWLNPDGCWHKPMIAGQGNSGRNWQCANGDCNADLGYQWDEPKSIEYHTESGFFVLLSGLRAKGFEIECDSICQSRADGWDVRLYLHDVLAISNAKAHADNLPEALFKASLAALESEGTE